MQSQNQLVELESSLKLVGAQGRGTIRAGAFEAYLSASENPTMSFATPVVDDPNWSESIEALCIVFAERDRHARLEYFHELYPTLAPALEAAGFEQTSAAPVMTLAREALSSSARPTQSTYLRLSADEPERLKAFLVAQSLAYSGTGGEKALAWLSQLTEGLGVGTILAAALEQGGALNSGAVIQVGGEVGELAGVWTRPDRQRQGLAYALCGLLLGDYFAAGFELCWLSAAEGAQGVYRSLGFQHAGTQFNYELPSGN